MNRVYDQDVTVSWQTANGSATQPTDYTTSSGTLTIVAGQTSGTVSVPINNDTTDEGDETFTVTITGVTNAELGDGSAICNIIDNDAPSGSMPLATVSSTQVEEGDVFAAFTVSLTQATNETVRIHFATSDGTAIDGIHYYGVSEDIYFAPNQTSAEVHVSIQDDNIFEPGSSPYFFVTISSPVNALIGTSGGYALITDDDPAPQMSISDVTVTEGDPGGNPVNADFLVSITNAASFNITYTVVITPGTALLSSDYSPWTTTFNMILPAGQTAQFITIPITADFTPEPTEQFYATITSASVVLTDYQGTCTILDTDPTFDLSADLITLNQSAGVLAENIEETVGAYVPLNDDDDDYDAQHKPDKDQDPLAGAIVGENDLLPITLHKVDPTSAGGTYTLTIPANIRVWTTPDRTGEVTAGSTFAATSDKRLYVEGIQMGNGLLRMNWTNGTRVVNDADRVLITVFDMSGPLNVPGYATYEYTASGGRAGDSEWLGSFQALTKANVNDDPATGLDYVDVRWSSGPFVGYAMYQASTGYVWRVDVNVVEVKISQIADTNVMKINETKPYQAIGGATLVGSQGSTMITQLDVQSITGPIVNGSMRGVSFIELGFIQTGETRLRRGSFPDSLGVIHRRSHVAEHDIVGVDTFGAIGDTMPWYDSTNSIHTSNPSIKSFYAPAADQQYNNITFAIDDTPRIQATDVPTITIGPGKPNSGEVVVVDEFDVLIRFNTYFAVRTRDAAPEKDGTLASEHFTRRTAAQWEMNALGKVVGAGPGAFGTWTASSSNSGSTSNLEESDGVRVAPTGGTPLNQRPNQWITDPTW